MNLMLSAALIGYLVGSIPFGLIFTKLAGLGDVRNIGSGNIGATNVLRTGNKMLAAATLICDMAKGTAAVLFAPMLGALVLGQMPGDDGATPTTALAPEAYIEAAAYAAGAAAFVGHVFPIWLGFRGGKGVATYIGILAGIAWPAAIVFCGIWLIIAIVTRYSSLSALVASIMAPLAVLYFQDVTAGVVAALMSVVLIAKHHANIRRLLAGEETRIGG